MKDMIYKAKDIVQEKTEDKDEYINDHEINQTGLPDRVKENAEALAGFSLDDVKVHYNAREPEELNAYAYTEKNQIYVASGQEEHLGHELWHVVQQKQGRVLPGVNKKGKSINKEPGLEQEATRMGRKIMSSKAIITDHNVKSVRKVSFNIGAVQLAEKTITLKKGDAFYKKKDRTQQGQVLEDKDKTYMDKMYYTGDACEITYDNAKIELEHFFEITKPVEEEPMNGFKGCYLNESKLSQEEGALRKTIHVKKGDVYADSADGGVYVEKEFPQDNAIRYESKGKNINLLKYNAEQQSKMKTLDSQYKKWEFISRPREEKEGTKSPKKNPTKNPTKSQQKKSDVPKLTPISALKELVALQADFPELAGIECSEDMMEQIGNKRDEVSLKYQGILARIKGESTKQVQAFEIKTDGLGTDPHLIFYSMDQASSKSSDFQKWNVQMFSSFQNLRADSETVDKDGSEELAAALSWNQFQGPVPHLKELSENVRNKEQSPFDTTAYARGTETKPWLLLNALKGKGLKEELLQYYPKKDVSEILTKYEIFSLRHLVETDQVKPEAKETLEDVIKENYLIQNKVVYIQSLKIQMVPKELLKDGKVEGAFMHQMNFKGARLSIGESVEECVNLIQDFLKKRAYSDKAFNSIKVLMRKITGKDDGFFPMPVKVGAAKQEKVGLGDIRREADEIDKMIETDKVTQEFFYTYNNKILQELIGENFKDDDKMPKGIYDMLLDALNTAKSNIVKTPEDKDADKIEVAKEFARYLDNFYFSMQKVHQAVRFYLASQSDGQKSEEDFLTAIQSVVPKFLDEAQGVSAEMDLKPAAVLAEPHGLAVYKKLAEGLAKIPEAELDGGKASATYLPSLYFETPEHFESIKHEEIVEKKPNVYVMEPHPNNAAMDAVEHKTPLDYLKGIFGEELKSERHVTVIMDITLNNMDDEEIKDMMTAEVKKLITDGWLNLILLQSGTKFLASGMDIVSLGTAIVFHKRDAAPWKTFDESIFGKKAPEEQAKPDYSVNITKRDQEYYTELLTKNKEQQSQYLNKIKENTRLLYNELKKSLPVKDEKGDGTNPIFLCESMTDGQADNIYVAIRFCNWYILEKCEGWKGCPELPVNRELNYAIKEFATIKILYSGLLKVLRPLGCVERQSFGFNMTNLGECGVTVRITPGIEPDFMIKQYAKAIIQLGENFIN